MGSSKDHRPGQTKHVKEVTHLGKKDRERLSRLTFKELKSGNK